MLRQVLRQAAGRCLQAGCSQWVHPSPYKNACADERTYMVVLTAAWTASVYVPVASRSMFPREILWVHAHRQHTGRPGGLRVADDATQLHGVFETCLGGAAPCHAQGVGQCSCHSLSSCKSSCRHTSLAMRSASTCAGVSIALASGECRPADLWRCVCLHRLDPMVRLDQRARHLPLRLRQRHSRRQCSSQGASPSPAVFGWWWYWAPRACQQC